MERPCGSQRPQIRGGRPKSQAVKGHENKNQGIVLQTPVLQVKSRYPAEKDGGPCDLRPDFDLPEPPLEYCEAKKPGDEVSFCFFNANLSHFLG